MTVFASQVTDQDTDDPFDAMLANYAFAFTIDAACRYALTGVGATIAAGSHGWNGSCADFVNAPSRISTNAAADNAPKNANASMLRAVLGEDGSVGISAPSTIRMFDNVISFAMWVSLSRFSMLS